MNKPASISLQDAVSQLSPHVENLFDSLKKAMRSAYDLNEVWDELDTLRFKKGSKTIFTLMIKEKQLKGLIIYGASEREKFEAHIDEFSSSIQELYLNSKTFHDGKWLFYPIDSESDITETMNMLKIKRKPFTSSL